MNSRAKGARGEREFRDVLRAAGYCKARRGQQFSGSPDSPDVVCEELPIHWEVKNCQGPLAIYDWIVQASRDRDPGHIPVVAHRRRFCQWLAILPMDQFLEIVRRSDLPATSERATEAPGAIERPSSAHLDCFGPSDGKGKVAAPKWEYTGKP